MAKDNYTCLSDRIQPFKTGYLIVGNTLFEVKRGVVYEYWQLAGRTLEKKLKEAREVAELSKKKKIYYDDEKVFDESYLQDEGILGSYLAKKSFDEEDY